jgi:hypothetical protein
MTRAVGKLVRSSEASDAFMADRGGMMADIRADRSRTLTEREATRKLLLRLRRKHPGGDPYAVPMKGRII